MKDYFDTPKMPLSFYLDDGLVINVLWVIGIQIIIVFNWIPLLIKVGMIGWIGLSVYTYGWFSDYQIFKNPESRIYNLLFRKSTLFKKQFATEMGVVYLTSGYNTEYNNNNQRYETSSTFFGDLVRYVGLKTFIRILRAALMMPVMYITPLIHMNTMKKYRKYIEREQQNSSTIDDVIVAKFTNYSALQIANWEEQEIDVFIAEIITEYVSKNNLDVSNMDYGETFKIVRESVNQYISNILDHLDDTIEEIEKTFKEIEETNEATELLE